MAKDKQEQSAEQSATTVKAESAPAQTPAPATETNDGFQADRDSWGEAMAKGRRYTIEVRDAKSKTILVSTAVEWTSDEKQSR